MGGPQLKAREVLSEKDGQVGIVTLNRPEALNALSHSLMDALEAVLDDFEADAEIRCVVITGGTKVFAAGADIKEMENASSVQMARDPHLGRWDKIGLFPKPVIAAVAGFALGGGCELALACDLIVAGETAVFGQPEINIGVIPGAGGTQRLARVLGKPRALEMVLTGRRVGAREALAWGLVNRVVPAESLISEAKKLAREIAEKPPRAARCAKEAVLKTLDAETAEGLAFERRLFYSLFDTEDQKEGMRAFVEKRKPHFTGK